MNQTAAIEQKFIANITKLTVFTGGYCLFFGGLLFLVSLVASPSILLGAFLHLITGLMYLVLGNGVKRRSRKSTSNLSILSVTLAIASLSAIVYLLFSEWNFPALIGLLIFFIINLQLFIELLLWKRLIRRLRHSTEANLPKQHPA